MKIITDYIRNIDLTFFFRKKQINYDNLAESQLARVLTAVDLTALGKCFNQLKLLLIIA